MIDQYSIKVSMAFAFRVTSLCGNTDVQHYLLETADRCHAFRRVAGRAYHAEGQQCK